MNEKLKPINEFLREYLNIYTDGSIKNLTGLSGYIVIEDGKEVHCHVELEDTPGTNTAYYELTAINQALKYAISRNQPVIISTDYQQIIDALEMKNKMLKRQITNKQEWMEFFKLYEELNAKTSIILKCAKDTTSVYQKRVHDLLNSMN